MSAGTYIAHHPWLTLLAGADDVRLRDAQDLVKVGHSGRLGDRLFDSAYTTCWGEGWQYLAVFEVATKEDAERLEAAALAGMADFRFDGRELVRLCRGFDLGRVKAFIAHTAEQLGIAGRMVEHPRYPRTCPPRDTAAGAPDVDSDAELEALVHETCDVPETSAVVTDLQRRFAALSLAQEAAASSTLELTAAPAAAERRLARPAPASEDEDEEAAGDALDLLEGAAEAPLVLEDRSYQTQAADACTYELERTGRATLVMACRCGKTRVAHLVMRRLLEKAGPAGAVLFLVPGLSLLRQTVQKLVAYGTPLADVVMVGSGLGVKGGAAGDAAMTTDSAAIRAALGAIRARGGTPCVVSTYQSSHAACEGADAPYTLTVYDECHRLCGNRRDRPMVYPLLVAPPALTGVRLFMTATPDHRAAGKGGVTMSDHSLFGGVAYRYHLRAGIDAGHVNPFEIQLVASSQDAFAALGELRKQPKEAAKDATGLRWLVNMVKNLFGSADPIARASAAPLEFLDDMSGGPAASQRYLAAQIALALTHLTRDPARSKLLVFCRTIAQAEELRQLVDQLRQRLAADGNFWARLQLRVASSRTPPDELARVRAEFSDPSAPAVLFNCRLFQEGVEFPPLNAVFFASPRNSSRDIIQSMCRALTRTPGKPVSVVYIPVPPDREPAAGAAAFEGSRFETLLPFAEAIFSEDDRFYEHLLDPAGRPYPIGWLGVHGSGEELLHAARRAIRYATRGARGRQDRLTQNHLIPWNVAYKELQRTVAVCRRYPKTNDGFTFALAKDIDCASAAGAAGGEGKVINFGAWYAWVQREYRRFVNGENSRLQPHQVHDLLELPDWRTRGIEGPYPFDECLQALEEMLEKTKGRMPPININNGGWVGLDATRLERLSGLLTTISQQDGRADRRGSVHRGFKVSLQKALALDRVFGRWGLVWRKDRWYPPAELQTVIDRGDAADAAAAMRWLETHGRPGYLVGTQTDGRGEYSGRTTAIKAAHEQFVALAKANPNHQFVQANWPGYPLKHKYMEHLDVWEAGLAPPRVKAGRGEAGAQLICRGRQDDEA